MQARLPRASIGAMAVLRTSCWVVVLVASPRHCLVLIAALTHRSELAGRHLKRNLGRLVENDPAFELATAPQCNIICFRHLVPGLSEEGLNQHNEKIREQLKLEGKYYIVKTVLRGKTYLRCTLTNAFTEEVHLKNLLEEIKAKVLELAPQQSAL